MANSNAPTWRLIPLLQASGRMQMAIDHWLLQQHQLGLHPPTLRFYTWSPVAISLGYHQRNCSSSWHQLNWQGSPVELVRRPTGGRAVLHQGDLTYAVVTSGLTGSRIQVYQQICKFLIQGWWTLGVELHYGSAGRGYIHNPNCFGTATGADLVTAEGYKLIGSAQLRRTHAILQHGSMRLQPDVTLFHKVFGEKISPLKFPMTHQGKTLVTTVIEALTQSAEECFGVQLVVQPLSPEEIQAAVANFPTEIKTVSPGLS